MWKHALYSTDPQRPAWHPSEQPRKSAAKAALAARRTVKKQK